MPPDNADVHMQRTAVQHLFKADQILPPERWDTEQLGAVLGNLAVAYIDASSEKDKPRVVEWIDTWAESLRGKTDVAVAEQVGSTGERIRTRRQAAYKDMRRLVRDYGIDMFVPQELQGQQAADPDSPANDAQQNTPPKTKPKPQVRLKDILKIQDPMWYRHAACATADRDTFSENGSVQRAIAICMSRCTVREDCLNTALIDNITQPGTGVWGAMIPLDRRKLHTKLMRGLKANTI